MEITISFIIILDLLFIINNHDILRLFQQNGYVVVLNKTAKKIEFIHFVFTLFSAVLFLISYLNNLKYLAYIIYASLLIILDLTLNIYCRQKTAITKRFVRLIFTLSILNFILIATVEKYCFILLPILFMLQYLMIAIANYINRPMEYIIKKVYMLLAIKKIKKKNIIVIGITGSAGKSSVKNILFEFLSLKYSVFKTEKNYNTTFGVIKSIKKLQDEQIFIVEMGARQKNDIKEICSIVKPNIGIITNVLCQHLSTFKNIDNIYKTKKELADYLKNGTVILNDYNDLTNKMKSSIKGKIFGIKDMQYKFLFFDGQYMHFKFNDDNKETIAKTKMLQLHNIENMLLAYKCARCLKIDKECLIKKMEEIENVDHRFNILKEGGITIIDDSYNANIEGCMNAINFLKNFSGRKIIFTQGVVELGDVQEKKNEDIGKAISEVADIVILLGINKDSILKGLEENNFNRNNIIILSDFSQVNKVFANILKKEDVVLIQNDLTDNY